MFAGFIVLLVTLQCTWLASASGKLKNVDSKIVYPGPIQEVPLNRYGGSNSDDDDIPEACKHKQYCTIKPRSYPQEKFNGLFKSKAPVETPSLVVTDINDRQGDPEEVDNCDTIVEFEPLYKVRSKKGDWRTVVQAPEKNYVQMVRLETCREESQACFTVFPKLPSYVTGCKQKYSTWEFVVEAEDGSGKTEKLRTDLPTCCSCHYKQT
ncbi:hypothetical protein ACJJTC_003436 [Scirpophaga incertulas]